MPVTQRKPKTVEELFRQLRDIHADVQTKFHDEWEWMDADFCIEALKVHFEAAQDRVKTLEDALREIMLFAIHGCATKQKDVRGKQFGAIVDICRKLEIDPCAALAGTAQTW